MKLKRKGKEGNKGKGSAEGKNQECNMLALSGPHAEGPRALPSQPMIR